MSEKQHTILVVDPDERSYKAFESALGASHSVLFVPNGKTAIDFPDSHPIDIVFVSHELNGIDGMHFLGSFKKRFPSIPVVLVVDKPKVDDVISAFRSGARELIVKPINKKELIAVTQKIFGFVPNKKSKRRWFFSIKKRTQTDNSPENDNDHIKKVDQKSIDAAESLAGASDLEEMRKAVSGVESAGYSLMLDSPFDSELTNTETSPAEPAESTQPLIEAFYFGSFRGLVNNQPIEDWPGKKGKSIFAYLLLNHRKKIFRDVLMDLFWQKSSPDSARNCLNVSIHGLRRVLQDIDPHNEYILFRDECYYFNPEIDIRLDVDAFRSIWRKAQRIEHMKDDSVPISEYERAAQIYRGEFLEDEIYDSWSALDRENLKEIYLVILDKISEFYVLSKKHSEVIGLCEKILEKDNCREDIHRRLMLSYYRIGQRDKAIKQFQKCVEVLKEELEVRPSIETTNLFEQLKRDSLMTKN
ncbi:MAG: BTAD domain-containing putative transcriptional regulator [Desulfobacterales bacterium]|jgi:two-component SAPR family response regulator